MPVPIPKSNELIDRLRATSDGPEYDLALRSIERDADRLMQSGDRAGAWLVKGIIATHRLDETKAREAFKNALNLSRGNLVIEQNFVRSLMILGCYEEALDRALKLVERDGIDVDFIKTAYRTALRAGAFHLAAGLVQRVHKLKVETELDMSSVLEVLEREQVTDEEIRDRARVVSEVVRNRGLRVRTFHWRTLNGAEPVNVTYVVDATPSVVADLNVEIADALCSTFEDPLNRAVIFDCAPSH